MDLLEEVLATTHSLSTNRIKKLIDAIANRIPHQWLPCLGCAYYAAAQDAQSKAKLDPTHKRSERSGN